MSIFNARTLFQYDFTRQAYLKLFPPQFLKSFSVLTTEEMFRFIGNGGSIVRFGDGEFSIMADQPPPRISENFNKIERGVKTSSRGRH